MFLIIFDRLVALRIEMPGASTQSVAELVRAMVLKKKILFFAIDKTVRGPMIDLAGIWKELKAIGTNINQITHAFQVAERDSQKVSHALRVGNSIKWWMKGFKVCYGW